MNLSTPSVPNIQTQDQNINKLQNNILQGFNSLVTNLNVNPFIAGNYFTGISIVAGTPFVLIHNLGLVPQGYIITSLNAATQVYQSAITVQSITFNASASCAMNVWVF